MTTPRAYEPGPETSCESQPSPTTVRSVEVAEFTAFYKDDVHALGVFLRSLGANATVATDIAADVMGEAYHQWSSIRMPRTWVRTVARRKYLRALFAVDLSGEVSDAVEADHGRDIADSVAPHVAACGLLARLPLRQRQVMAWHLDGYTPTETAQELQISPGAVRSSLAAARQALGDLLREGTEQ
ncbi:RNA polymerase sigma factor [Catellatospora bangladeshensis]|uniref:RNA polymerase sigma24 factor n=1 Tax=Catellatospora bangladeshensis TaxID=310355 RepID=A0A8J3NM85_9ACTN|nr:sigma factor-like helix-turn-helix DNA-binding protein [Catellatospora bangladeshensis]GIF85872.1 RNA polymerase sigma24 factor [Catellatospora bangladeshensis]